MKTVSLFIALAMLTLVAGCSQIQAKLNSQVQAIAVPDVQAALTQAIAINDADGVACWTDWLAYVNSLPTGGANTPPPTILGLATALEASRELSTGTPVVLPPIPHQLHRDCAVLLVDAQQLAAKLGLTAAALGKGIPVVKGLEVLQSMPVKP